MSDALKRLRSLTDRISSFEVARTQNLKDLRTLYDKFEINSDITNFENIFNYSAMNLAGISLQEENLGEIKSGKYVQIIIIESAKNGKKAKNINLCYFGRSDKLEVQMRANVVEFVLRWRFEKSFRSMQHYFDMINLNKKSVDA